MKNTHIIKRLGGGYSLENTNDEKGRGQICCIAGYSEFYNPKNEIDNRLKSINSANIIKSASTIFI